MSYTFFIPGKPKGKERPRFTKQGHAYTPDKTKAYETLVKLCWKEAGGVKLTGPIKADIMAWFHVPTVIDGKRLRKSEREAMYYSYQTGKPDADNIAKAVLDALNGLAYDDDSAVVRLSVRKGYCRDDEQEGVTVTLWEVK